METLSEAETQEILKGVLGELVDSLKEKKTTLEDYFDQISAIQRVSKHETRCWVAKMSDQRLLRDWDALEEEDEPLPPESSESHKRYRGDCYKKFKKDEQSSDDNSQGNTYAVNTSTSSAPAVAAYTGNSTNSNSFGQIVDTNSTSSSAGTATAGVTISQASSTKKIDLLESDSKIRCPIADSIMKKYENIRVPGERYRQSDTESTRYDRNSKYPQDISFFDYQNQRYSNNDYDERRSNKQLIFKDRQPYSSRSANAFVKSEYSQQQSSLQLQPPRGEQQKEFLNKGMRNVDESQQQSQQDLRFDSLNDSFGVMRSSNAQQKIEKQPQQKEVNLQSQTQPSFDSREYEDQVEANQTRFDSKEYFKRAQVAAEAAVTVNANSEYVQRTNTLESNNKASVAADENEKSTAAAAAAAGVPMTPKRQERVASSSATRGIQEEETEKTEGSAKKKSAKEFSYASPIQKVNQDWMELSSSVRQGISCRQSPSFR